MLCFSFFITSFIFIKLFKPYDTAINDSDPIVDSKKIFSESSCLRGDTGNDDNCNIEEEKSQTILSRWNPVRVGYEREISLEIGKTHKMITMAVNPPIFIIDNYLEDYECDYIKHLANESGLFSSELHMDPDTLRSKNYTRYELTDYSSIFNNIDYNQDDKINIPSEIQKLAYQIHHLYLKESDIDEIIHKFDIKITEDNNDRWITREDYAKVNVGGMLQYFADVRESHPHHRDRYSEQTWLNVHRGNDRVIKKMMERLEIVTGLPQEIVHGTEPIQVVKYMPYGHYHAHFDSQNKSAFPDFPCCHTMLAGTGRNCRICRYLTALVFLNDVIEGGETAFPVADDPIYTHEEFLKRKDGDLYNLSQFCHKATVIVKPKKGRMVLWYNHKINEEGLLGILDPYSLHGGCDVIKGEKWIANNWIPAPETANLLGQNVYKPRKEELLVENALKDSKISKDEL